MLVLKFGGTSMGSAQSMNDFVAEIVKKSFANKEKPVVVVSAMTGVTNELIALVEKSIQQHQVCTEMLEGIKARHEKVIATITNTEYQKEARNYLESELEELANLTRALMTIGEIPSRSLDAVLGVGEKLSAKVFSCILNSKGIHSEFCNFEAIIPASLHYKDDRYWDKVASLLADKVKSLPKDCVAVGTGFFGRTQNGIITDVGRGYSDYCASLLGAGLGSPEIQIWTDVDGVLSANPKVVPTAFINRDLSFDEMAELATFGAKVLHPFSVRPAVNANIPIRIVNTFNAQDPGTLVKKEARISSQPFKSITSKSGVTLIRISTPQMLLAHGFISKLGQVLANHEVAVDLIATSEVSVSFSIEKGPENVDQMLADLGLLGQVSLTKNQSIISLVGAELSKDSTVISRALSVFEKNDLPIHMLSMSDLRINLSVVTEDALANKATELLHKEFFS